MDKTEMYRCRQWKDTCNRLGRLFGEIAEALQGLAVMEMQTAQQARMEEDMLRTCIYELMEERDAKGRHLVNSKCQWQAIYRVLVDKGIGVAEGDYTGFEQLVWRIQPTGCRVPFSLDALKQITKTGYTRPLCRWTFDPSYFRTRRPFERMLAIAIRFSEILENHMEAGAL